MVFRKLTMDDMKDKLTITGSLFDVLLTTAERANEIYETEERKNPRETETLPPKKKKTMISRERIILTPAAPRGGEEEEERGTSSTPSASKKSKRNPPPVKKGDNGPSPPPPLPEEVKRAIEEMARGRRSFTPAKLVIQKMLRPTDLSLTHNRMSIPMSMIREDFLKEEEKRYLRCYEGSNKKFKEVMMFEPSLEVETVKLCRWDMKKKDGGKTSSAYIINGTWNDVARRNKLRPWTFVQLWSFRLDEDLCFALVRIPQHQLLSSA